MAVSHETFKELNLINKLGGIDEWKNHMLSTYTNGETGWDHRSMFFDRLMELKEAKKNKVMKDEAADKLINMVKG